MDWYPDWAGETCIIVAGGPSAKETQIEEARGQAKFIAVNTSYKLCPWADVLYACDMGWWRVHKGVPDFAGLKVSQDVRVNSEKAWNIRLVRCDRSSRGLVLQPRGRIGWGGHGGFHAINLAVQFGAKRLLLVGFDMRIDKGLHWHGAHPRGLNNPSRPTVDRWRVALDGLAEKFRKLGIEVINCSAASSLTAYQKMELIEALNAKSCVDATAGSGIPMGELCVGA